MSSNPINLALRFLLEVASLIVMGIWGWNQTEEWIRYLLALAIPIIAAIVWGTFAVPNDPSRSGNAPVPVHGVIRLVIELTFFVIAVLFLHLMGTTKLGIIMGAIVFIHYIISYDRVVWLLKR